MSEIITIKAELLKWCPRKFPFIINNGIFHIMGVVGEVVEYTGCRIGVMKIHFMEDVQVNAKDYEEACIARIKEMFDIDELGLCKIKKSSVGVDLVVGIGRYNTKYVQINCDPRPNEESYEIEL